MTRFAGVSIAITCAMTAVTMTRAAAYESGARPAPQKLPYSECVALGSKIAVQEGNFIDLKRRISDERVPERIAALHAEMATLAAATQADKAKEAAGCVGVTIGETKAATGPATQKPLGGVGAATADVKPEVPAVTPGVRGGGDGITNPLCKERIEQLDKLMGDQADTPLKPLRAEIATLKDEIRVREVLLAGDLPSPERARVAGLVQAAKSKLAAKEAEETSITGRIDILRQGLESLGCDPDTGKTTGVPRRTGGNSGSGGTGNAGGSGANTPAKRFGGRDIRFTGTFELWVRYRISQKAGEEEHLGTITLRDIDPDVGRRLATEKLGGLALVDLRNCGTGPNNARQPRPNREYYEGQILWTSTENSFTKLLNRGTKTRMDDARVLACSDSPEVIYAVFEGSEGRDGQFQLIRRGEPFVESDIYFGRSSAKLFVRVR